MYDTTDELLNQVRLGEDTTLELKNLEYRGQQVTAPHRESMADELAAMANTTHGVFVLGVDDKSRSIVGIPLEKLDAVDQWIGGICNDLIKPALYYRMRKISTRVEGGGERIIVRIDIPRSLYIHQSPGGYFHRMGDSKRQMTPEVLSRLFQQRSQTRIIRFDEQAVAVARKECLDQVLWKKLKTTLSPEDDQDFLLKLKLLTTDEDGEIRPTVAGILLASENPEKYLPNAFIQAVSYRGTERNGAYQLDAKDIVGPLDVQIHDACKFVEKNMKVRAIKNPARQEIPQYAMQAVFEAVVNAVAHRDYSIHGSKIRLHMFSDRIELFSPGTIPNTMTIDSLPLRQAARNELISSVLARCPLHAKEYSAERKYLMDKRGEGVPIILTESEKLAGCKPEYRLIDDTELLLTIHAANSADSGHDEA
ncbi:MAG: putative DNA binding domain-containing protein [Magnetococcales bacterium]|nr:putative DNA binding domain-containing protein [Magnetococcales bacterium]MBF0322400.1 putative DNA binding domain-containing protein [Magnetococcales bacterium]